MKISATLLSISTVLCGVFALPPKIRSPVGTQWSVYNHTEGCSPAACEYGFNIAWGSSPTDEPAFSTYCQGSDIAYKLQPCQDPAISSNEVSGFQNVTVVVQHFFETSDGAGHYVVGNYTFEDVDGNYPSAFGIQQSEVRAVA
ncbi:hypothetical protein L207DRAFT_3838 [Hyaloscypha variabilis F]|jgi:hypothetical protein|uniref:Hypersensitive response-inducing protein n=1 Tax=Hyaloscypha variabilis (strain UAMH 11265 / GT02V1 / F) TaxID=1149755 RepID=A0A2J6SBX8_HYAVF|nr:hypothetical protein L207DRAFT_3838 [Hyaloscypha variabilis F]